MRPVEARFFTRFDSKAFGLIVSPERLDIFNALERLLDERLTWNIHTHLDWHQE